MQLAEVIGLLDFDGACLDQFESGQEQAEKPAAGVRRRKEVRERHVAAFLQEGDDAAPCGRGAGSRP